MDDVTRELLDAAKAVTDQLDAYMDMYRCNLCGNIGDHEPDCPVLLLVKAVEAAEG